MVDDSRVVRKIARRIIEEMNSHAVEAENREKALQPGDGRAAAKLTTVAVGSPKLALVSA